MSASTEQEVPRKCAVCLDNSVEPVHCCSSNSDDLVTCKTCLVEYIHNRLAGLVSFVCPQLPCPCHVNTLLDFGLLEAAVSSDLLLEYENSAGLALQFRCGSCHVSSCMATPFNRLCFDNDSETKLNERSKGMYADAFAKYASGHMSVDALYSRLKTWSNGFTHDDAWIDFSRVLGSIPNPERRNALHLRYLRDQPIFATTCCEEIHCFQCKVHGDHSGRTCEEVLSEFDPSTLSCLCCGITLAKGDGCDHVTCVCGFDFDWTEELMHFSQAESFKAAFPLNTNLHCVSELCAEEQELSSLSAAEGWRHRHQFEVDAELEIWWQLSHPLHTDQCCVILTQGSVGKLAARDVWKMSHYASVQRKEDQRNIAIASLFESLYVDCDRDKAAAKLRDCGHADRLLVESAARWLTLRYGQY